MTDLDSARRRARTNDPELSRPSDLAVKDIEQKQFATARRGYAQHEVRAFLLSVAFHLDGLERELARTKGRDAQLEAQLERTKLELQTLQAELAEQRVRHVEISSRLELCQALREDAFARAAAAESGRQHAEELLAQVQLSRPPEPANQVGAFERAAATPGSADVLELARGHADRLNRFAQELADLLGVPGGRLREGAPSVPEPPPNREPEAAVAAKSGAPPVRFTTNQARAAAVALHSSAQDDLRLAEFWIQEAEQEGSEDAIVTSRIILGEARQLLNMAAELGHPAPELLEQYTELDRRARRPRS